MKRIFILTMMLSFLVFNSCDEINGLEKELQDEASIVLAENQKTELTISPRGETIDIKFKSTLAWSAEVQSSASYKDMIEFIPNKGDGGDAICKVKILKNESGKTRTFTLIMTSEDIKVEFNLTQKSLDKHSDKDQDDEDEDEDGESGDDDTGGETNDGGNTNGYLVNYEVPFADITLNAGEDYSSRVSETNGGSAYAYIYDTKTTNQRIVTHTFNNNGIHRNYTFLYDYEKRCPIWLAYHLNEGFCSSSGDRTESWSYDPAIPEISQPNLSSSYSLGGDPYNRGHMLASNPRTGITNANTQTFYYTNMTPQLGKTFNTGGGVWNNLENAEDSFIPSKGSRDTLYVVTGCLFDDNVTTTICRKDGLECAVPDDFYKCFMLCSFDSNGRMTAAKGIGYLMPHETPLNTEYSKFAMSIDKIEALAGFDFFCNVPKSLQDKAESNTTELF